MKKKLLTGLIIIAFTVGIVGLVNASPLLSDPTPSISYSGNIVTLHKELYRYTNYGSADTASDILYAGDSGSWVFNLTSLGLSFSDFSKASLTASLALDDSPSITSNYSMSINLFETNVFSGLTDTIDLVHGSPHGGKFSNWTGVSFDPLALSNPLTVTMQNTTSPQTGGWIGIDYIELRLTPVPEPATMLLLGLGLLGLAGVSRRKQK